MGEFLDTFRWLDLLDIILVALLIHRAVSLLRNALALRLLLVLNAVFIVAVISLCSGLRALQWLLNSLLGSAVVIAVVIFHTDIRRAILTYGRVLGSTPHQSSDSAEVVDAVTVATASLAARNIGSLIVLERQMGLGPYIEVGTEIDAKVTSELLTSIFLPYSPIHDGAVIIKRGKLTLAGCFLPLTRNPEISKNLGTRHRAAIGLTELVDAVVVVVSEETGSISAVTGGRITRDMDMAELRKFLVRSLEQPVERDGHA
jgi:diadenylate cyclase